MLKTMRVGFVAAVTVCAMSSVFGCTGNAITGALASAAGAAVTSGGTNGAPATQANGQACTTPAAAPTTGTAAEGDYVGLTLPNGWDTSYASQAEVDDGFTNLKTSNPSAWTSAKCIYAPAIAKWATNTGQTP